MFNKAKLNVFSRIISSYNEYRQATSKTKNIIRSVVGQDVAITRPVEDIGDLYSAKTFFKKTPVHYSVFEGKSATGISWGERYSHDIGLNYDEFNNFDGFRLYSHKSKSVSLYDRLGQMIGAYTPEETKAIQYYKRDSKDIHKYLRYNKPVKNEQEVSKNVKIISDLFKQANKTSLAKEDFVVYRALDSKALKEILSMPKDGMIYTEPSFLSVATKKSSTYQFLGLKNFNHILKLKVKKGTKYLDMDKISVGRIVQPQMAENELVFDKGAKIIVTNRHAKGGFIEAELID